jgi:3-hydroxyacyl-CoA dehydrogenase
VSAPDDSQSGVPVRRVAVLGLGLVGCGWAVAFARAGREVAAFDASAAAVERGLATIRSRLDDFAAAGLLGEPPSAIQARIRPTPSLPAALDGADYAQESISEVLAAKREFSATVLTSLRPGAVLASSTSTFMASEIYGGLPAAARCLVAHPVNPPDLVPLVEVAPAPFTAPDAAATTVRLMREIGQSPIVLRREVQGFVLNRLQWALFAEACRLVRDGYATVEDVDATVRDGLGMRWAFMGPFEVGDLNAPDGLRDYVLRFGPMIEQMNAASAADPVRLDAALAAELHAGRRSVSSADSLPARRRWRDRRLMALAAHRRAAEPPPSED